MYLFVFIMCIYYMYLLLFVFKTLKCVIVQGPNSQHFILFVTHEFAHLPKRLVFLRGKAFHFSVT
jgi:hypothetical protein